MKNIRIFEPAMCCATGLCGPSIDPELLRISTLLFSLKEKGIVVERYNLTSHPQVFAQNEAVKELLSKHGTAILPVTISGDDGHGPLSDESGSACLAAGRCAGHRVQRGAGMLRGRDVIWLLLQRSGMRCG